MKKKSLGLFAILTIYILICLFSYMDSQRPKAFFLRHGNYMTKIHSDQTTAFNRDILSDIFTKKEEYDTHRYLDLFDSFALRPSKEETLFYYVTNLHDVEKLIKDHKITNTRKIDYKTAHFSLPLEDKNYQAFFQDAFSKEKKEARVIGKDEKGYSKFDISPDALILATINHNIVGYGYIDNRLLDTREVMNQEYKVSLLTENKDDSYSYRSENQYTPYIVRTNSSSYNVYALQIDKSIYKEENHWEESSIFHKQTQSSVTQTSHEMVEESTHEETK